MSAGAVVHSKWPVTLLGGGVAPADDVATALELAPTLVAADGGAGTALALGLRPEAVIGDMDSLSPEAAAAFAPCLHPVAEQDTTDFDKALTRIEAPVVLAVGFAGGRLDHELAALHSLVLRADRPCLLLGPDTLAFHAPPEIDLPLAPGTLVSIFPFAPLRLRSDGLRWPTDHLEFAPDRRIGTSNEAAGPVRLRPSTRGALVILPRATLPLALDSLRAAPRWPPAPGG
ncbi:thiamine diphosphokinase [Rubellimicrobium arenae]|uniref:thiamine diphosphokinase n=1 Tax=Rubellimicrobium arenae TaxID=2817372 RepID=UPI001B3181C9|nr:thiamine diphosphokinase [Rubellimicrobium arenae]